MPSHCESRHSPYAVEQLLQLVSDVERYPEFLPWCKAAKIHKTQQYASDVTVMEAELVIRFKQFREVYLSQVTVTLGEAGPSSILVTPLSGPFSHLQNEWIFTPDSLQGGTNIEFMIEFEFRSTLLGSLIGLFFEKATQKMLQSFEERAQTLYGQG